MSPDRLVLIARIALAGAVALAGLMAGPRSATAGPTAAAPDRAEADAHLDEGFRLYKMRLWDAALAEFREARRLYPFWTALFDAGLCLEKLQRDDEALNQVEAALRESEGAEAEDKSRIERKVVELRGRVGTLELDGAEAGAAVTVDGRSRGEAPRLAPLRVSAGRHLVRLAKGGFEPFVVEVDVAGGQTARVAVRLRALERSGRLATSPSRREPPRRPRFIAELGTAVAVLPTLGGDVAGGCTGACSAGAGIGGEGVVHGGYELGSGLAFGVTAGVLSATQTVNGRTTSLTPLGMRPDRGAAGDRLVLRGALVGAWVGWSILERVPVHLRLGAGALLGSVDDTRTFQGTASDGAPFRVGPVIESHGARFFYVIPELRVGLPLSRRVELNLGLGVPVLVSVPPPQWGFASGHPVFAGSDRSGAFSPDALVSRVLVLFAPGVGARYDL